MTFCYLPGTVLATEDNSNEDIFRGTHKLVKKMVNILKPLLVGELNC